MTTRQKNVIILMLGLLVGGYSYAGIAELTPQQVYKEAKSGMVVILDVNPEGFYKKHHVPESKNVNFYNLAEALPKDKSKRLIFYCMSEMCSASHQTAQIAVKNGYKDVARMPSGISGWLKADLPVGKL